MSNDEPKRPLGASTRQPLTPEQQKLLTAFKEALERAMQSTDARNDEELSAAFDKMLPNLKQLVN
jgi:hypothetical protein